MKDGEKAICIVGLVVFLAMITGCGRLPSHPPQTLSQWARYSQSGSQDFTPRMIALHNARRVADENLSQVDRLESLRVLERLGKAAVDAHPVLITVLGESSAPATVRQEVLGFLAERDCEGLGKYIADALPSTREPKLRQRFLQWLLKHPTRTSLAGIVKSWAADKSISEEQEVRYRRLVEYVAGKPWFIALFDALNSKEFYARGSAIEVLSARMRPEQLRSRISTIKPKTYAMRVLRYFADYFGYVPSTRRELLSAVRIYHGKHARLVLAERLVNQWQKQYDYHFNIRDFHLLSRLAADPLRKELTRGKLILEISHAIASRRQEWSASGAALALPRSKRLFRRGRLVDFDSQVESLTMADLWNLYLISKMIDRERIRRELQITAQQDRADVESQWGGLIKYQQGQAEALLYPPAAKQGDDKYIPSKRMLSDSLDSLCYFVGHFDKVSEDVSQVGPGIAELAFSTRYNLYGVVFTSMKAGWINATYFNPDGIVVNLGSFRPGIGK